MYAKSGVDGQDATRAGCFDFAILSVIYAYSISGLTW